MTPLDPRWQVDAYVDGELDLAGHMEVESRLRSDADLRQQAEAMRGLSEAVRSRAEYHAAPPALRARVRQLVQGHEPASRRHSMMAWGGAGLVSAAAASVLAFFLVLAPMQAERRVGDDVVASHVRSTLGERAVDVASSDHHTVKPWLSSKLDFSPEVREVSGGHAVLLGGRVDYVGGRPVAVLVYRVGAHVADDFTWPSSGGEQPVALSSSRGFHVAAWTRGGMTHRLISDLNRDELAQFARQLRAP